MKPYISYNERKNISNNIVECNLLFTMGAMRKWVLVGFRSWPQTGMP